MTTALDIISESLRIAGVLGQTEVANAAQADQGLLLLNDLLDMLSIDRTNIYTITQNSFTLVNGQASYTIGATGNFVMTRPVVIDNVFIRINSIDYKLLPLSNKDYDGIAYKNNGGFPSHYYYDANFPLGTIYLYGVPTQGTLYIDTWSVLTQFTNLASNITFPLGYNLMIKYQLAKMVAGRYGSMLTQADMQIANDSLAAIKNRNLPSYTMKTELQTGTRGYSFYAG